MIMLLRRHGCRGTVQRDHIVGQLNVDSFEILQVWRWAQQYKSQLLGEPMPEMMALIGWLQSHLPAEDADPTVTRISHGDFRCAAIAHTVSLPIPRHGCLHSLLLSLCTWKVGFL